MDLKDKVTHNLSANEPVHIEKISYNTPPWDKFLSYIFLNLTPQNSETLALTALIPTEKELLEFFYDAAVTREFYSFLVEKQDDKIEIKVFLHPFSQKVTAAHTTLIWQSLGAANWEFNNSVIKTDHADVLIIPKGTEYGVTVTDASAWLVFSYKD